MKLTDKQRRRRDAGRDIGAEVLRAVRDIGAGKGKRVTVTMPVAAEARRRVGRTPIMAESRSSLPHLAASD
jgi:putative transcriptional regulator